MAASAPIVCTADQWIKVATAVTSAIIHKLSTLPNVYKQTYVATGAAVPANDDNAILAFGDCDQLTFAESASSDIYIKAVRRDGSVRTDA